MASGWRNMDKANANEGDARYGWEAGAEQMQNWQLWGKKSEHRHNHLQLSDVVGPKENVIWWVDTIEGLVEATKYFSSAEVEVVGMDCEWKPNYVKGADPNQVSILQIATRKKVLIIDLIGLFDIEPNLLDTCLKVVFHSPKILKLGYSFHHDLKQLFQSYGALECFHFCDGILDLQELHGSSKGGLSGLAKTVLGSDLNKGIRMSNWERRPLTPSQLRYAALDAAVLIAIFDVLCCESSSPESAGTQHTSHWPSLVTCYKPYEKHERNPEALLEADLAGASMGEELADNQTCYKPYEKHERNPEALLEADLAGASMGEELADNQISRIIRKQVDNVSIMDSKAESMDFRRNSSTTRSGNFGAKWKTQPKPALQANPFKAGVVGRSGPATGCWTCGGDHYQNECPQNSNKTTKPPARINAAMYRNEADNQASPIELQGTRGRRGQQNTPRSTRKPGQKRYITM